MSADPIAGQRAWSGPATAGFRHIAVCAGLGLDDRVPTDERSATRSAGSIPDVADDDVSVPPRPEQVATVLVRLLLGRNVIAAHRILRSVALDDDRLRRAAGIVEVARLVTWLDAEDFDVAARTPGLPGHVAEQLRACAWPRLPDNRDRGALASLRPTYGVLLELFEWHAGRDEVTDALALLHLMSEYLPLLVWQDAWGHAGDPPAMTARLGRPAAAWEDPDRCPLDKHDRAALTWVSRAVRNEGRWQEYLRTRHSRVAWVMATCAGVPRPEGSASSDHVCRRPCGVVDDLDARRREAIAWRMVLARRFHGSSALDLRHGSPVGHFFAVPDWAEVLRRWDNTWSGLLADHAETPSTDNPLSSVDRDGALPGLAALLGVCAGLPPGEPMPETTLLRDLCDAAVAVLRG